MSFDVQTKEQMFIACHRICCLCFKRCGTNIEAAHIVQGGSDDFDNGIPLCFDCHQEVGAYDDKHPRGNKFRPNELRARRDRHYLSIKSGLTGALNAGWGTLCFLWIPGERTITVRPCDGPDNATPIGVDPIAIFLEYPLDSIPQYCGYAIGDIVGYSNTGRKTADEITPILVAISNRLPTLSDFGQGLYNGSSDPKRPHLVADFIRLAHPSRADGSP